MLLYTFRQVIKTVFQLPTPIFLWVILCQCLYPKKKKKSKKPKVKQKVLKTLLLIISASVANDIIDRYQALWIFYKYFSESKIQ